jgi:hypothetical protein
MKCAASWEAINLSASQEIPCPYGTWNLIIVFITAHQRIVSESDGVQNLKTYNRSY